MSKDGKTKEFLLESEVVSFNVAGDSIFFELYDKGFFHFDISEKELIKHRNPGIMERLHGLTKLLLRMLLIRCIGSLRSKVKIIRSIAPIIYPIYRFFTGYGYDNEWFCNPLWCFIAKWPLVFEHKSVYLASLISMGFTLWLLPPVITVAFYFYCDWKNKWTWFIYGVFVISCLFSLPIPIETGRSLPFIYYWSTY